VTSSSPREAAPYPHSTDQLQTSQPSQPVSQTSSPHLTDNASGTHLFALPHSGVTPPYRYMKHQDATIGTS